MYKLTGFEPERVAALNRQSGGLSVASESLSGSESQIAFAIGKGGKSLNLRQETHRISGDFFIYIDRNEFKYWDFQQQMP